MDDHLFRFVIFYVLVINVTKNMMSLVHIYRFQNYAYVEALLATTPESDQLL